MKNKEIVITMRKPGRCAGCGKKIHRYSTTYQWYICVRCESKEVLADIAHHVTHPND